MKIKKIYILIVSLILLVFVVGAYLIHLSVLRTPSVSSREENINTINKNLLEPSFIKTEVNREKEPQIETEPLSRKNIKITLNILDKSYELEVDDNSSVFEIMKELQIKKNSDFSFTYKEYSGMGVFINEINGIKGKSGAYWIYYINGKEASVGVSNYILKDGDSILWKQE